MMNHEHELRMRLFTRYLAMREAQQRDAALILPEAARDTRRVIERMRAIVALGSIRPLPKGPTWTR